jgi:hypothetical protein
MKIFCRLVEQLSDEQKQDLLMYLRKQGYNRPLTPEERLAVYHASIMNRPVKNAPSVRREDWYGDDGR